MPSLITTPSADLLAECERVHREAGLDFPVIFDRFFREHYVFKGPDYLVMAMDDPNDRDAWYVWYAASTPPRSPAAMLRLFLRHMPHYRARVAWWRPLKNKGPVKYYSTDRLLRFIEAKA